MGDLEEWKGSGYFRGGMGQNLHSWVGLHLKVNVLVCGWGKQTNGRLLAHPVTLQQEESFSWPMPGCCQCFTKCVTAVQTDARRHFQILFMLCTCGQCMFVDRHTSLVYVHVFPSNCALWGNVCVWLCFAPNRCFWVRVFFFSTVCVCLCIHKIRSTPAGAASLAKVDNFQSELWIVMHLMLKRLLGRQNVEPKCFRKPYKRNNR